MENVFSTNHLDSEANGSNTYGSDPSAPDSSVYVDFIGQVGIGTKTPTNKLDVEGNATINGGLTISNPDSGSFSVIAAAKKIPVGNASGQLDASWLAGIIPPGSMFDFAGAKPPEGFLLCDGSAVSRTTYPDLFTAIGVIWGAGDNSTTFNLPNLQRCVAVGSGGAGSATIGNAVGNKGGAETHTLGINDIPNHNHNFYPNNYTGLKNNSGGPNGGTDVGSGNYNITSGIVGYGAQTAISLVQSSAIVTKMIKY